MSQLYVLRCDACGLETSAPPKDKWFEVGISMAMNMFLPRLHFCSVECLAKVPAVLAEKAMLSKEHGNGGKS